jgi:hypothetical protein
MSILLTQKGQEYARYAFLTHRLMSKIPFLGKYVIGTLAGMAYSMILQEGANYHAAKRRQKTQAKMSRMRNGNSSDQRRDARRMREMRDDAKGVSAVHPLAISLGENESTEETSIQENGKSIS